MQSICVLASIDSFDELREYNISPYLRRIITQNDANTTEWIFFSSCFKWLVLMWEFASVSSGAWQFLNTNISQECSNAFEAGLDI